MSRTTAKRSLKFGADRSNRPGEAVNVFDRGVDVGSDADAIEFVSDYAGADVDFVLVHQLLCELV